ncbi:phage tail tape measure protein [Sutcliffiella halmapala]
MSTYDIGGYRAEITLDNSGLVRGLNDADKAMNNSEKKVSSMGKVIGGVALGAVAGLAAAFVGIAGAGFKASDDLQKALNGLQSSTGATEVEIKAMEDSLMNIYNNNFGESFQDIADSMALVKQNTGLTGEALENATQNALMLRDTFGKDVSESTNAANSLMKQFGISSEEAFNLMAQGIQNGADKNGDLLDTLNEYAPAYEALGFTAEEFTNSLIDGAENGAFSIDKVGDAVKEFNIRAKDGSKASAEGYELLGLNAEEMTAKFAAGGDTAQTAFQQVMDSLNSLEDPVDKNTAGVALFGSMFEDLEADAIGALGNIGTTASLSNDALAEINEVKYDSFGEAMSGIGRNFQTAMIEPMREHVLPLLGQFTDFIIANMPQIQEFISNAFTVIGDVIGTAIEYVSKIKTAFTEANDSTNSNFSKIKEVITDVINTVKEIIASFTESATILWQKYGDDIVKYATSAFENISKVISGVLDVIKGIINTVLGVLTGDWDKAWKGIKQIVSGVFEAISGVISQALNVIKTTVNVALSFLADLFSDIWNGIKSTVSSVVSGIVDNVKSRFNTMKSTVSDIFNNVWTSAKDIFNKIKNAITSPITDAVDTVKKMIQKIKDAFNFSWSLPKLKLPKVSVSMKENSWGIPYPDFDIKWHKYGGFFDKPTIAGLGEAGKEAIVPLVGNQMNPFADAVYQRLQDRILGGNTTYNRNNNSTTSHNQDITVHMPITINSKTNLDANELKKISKYVAGSFVDGLSDRGMKFSL